MNRLGISLVLLALATPAVAEGAVSTAHSGWSWGTPRPQGQTLTAVEFAGPTGYAAGEFGTLLRSTDAGRTWAGLKTGLTEPLSTIRLLGPDSFVVGGTCALRRSDDGGRTFRRLPWTASDDRCSGGVRDVDFPDAQTGLLLLGNGNVLRSTDAGRTWSRRTAVPGTPATSAASQVQPTALDFVSGTTGFAVTSGGTVFKTDDAGGTWKAAVEEPWAIRAVTFPSASVGYAVGDAPALVKTEDGGATWKELGLPADAGALRTLRCATPDVCVGVTAAGDRVVRTVDGGRTFDSVAPSTVALRAVAMPSASQVVGVGDAGTTVSSSDGGTSYQPVGDLLIGRFTALTAVSAKLAFASGEGGALARTTDGGESWQQRDAATSDAITDLSFLNDRVGFVLDRAGQLLRTDNAGESYELLDTGTSLRPEAVHALDPKRVLLVGPVGIRRSDDGGRTFTQNTQGIVRRRPLFDIDRAGSTILAYGPRAILRSTDAGRAWKNVKLPRKKTRIDVLDAVSARVFFLLASDGVVWRTDSGGRAWRRLEGIGTEVVYDLQFSDARRGFASVSEFGDERGGWVLRTEDGGRTWEPQLVAQQGLVRGGLAAPTARSGFALTESGSLFATSRGGAAGKASKLTLSSPSRTFRKRGDAVRVSGKLSGARGGERVVVSFREDGTNDWLFQDAVVSSTGTFTVVTRLDRTARFVAQWAGDDRLRGAGTKTLVVRGPTGRKRR